MVNTRLQTEAMRSGDVTLLFAGETAFRHVGSPLAADRPYGILCAWKRHVPAFVDTDGVTVSSLLRSSRIISRMGNATIKSHYVVVYERRYQIFILIIHPIFHAHDAMPAGLTGSLKLDDLGRDSKGIVRPHRPQKAQFVNPRAADDAVLAEKPTFNRQRMDG
jgi:hypothetical protein